MLVLTNGYITRTELAMKKIRKEEAYNRRRKAAGEIRVAVMIPEECREEFKALAEKRREEHRKKLSCS